MSLYRIILIALLLGITTFTFLQKGYSLRQDPGQMDIRPQSYTAGQLGTWTVTYTVGSETIRSGGKIHIQFPNSWHMNPWLFKMRRPPKDKLEQTERPDDWHYVGAACSRSNVKLSTAISNWGLDNQDDRFRRVFVVTVDSGELRSGDTVTLHYKKTTAPATSETNIIQIGVDTDGDGTTDLAPKPVAIPIRPDREKTAVITIPSRVQINTPAEMTIVVFDRFHNAVENFEGRFHLTATDPDAVLPDHIDITPADRGIGRVPVTFQTPGMHYITGNDNRYLASTGLLSNPIEVTTEKPEYQIYWGDVHSHCEQSYDGTGRVETAFQYARNVSLLDFYALTDHCDGTQVRHDREQGITPWEWEKTQGLVKTYNTPGQFITFLSYEWSSPAPYGHNNVFHSDDNAEVIYLSDVRHLQDLWKRLEGQQVFTMPHHTGIAFGGNSPGFYADLERQMTEGGRKALTMLGPVVDWRYRHPLRTSVEIYSQHGSSEFYGAPNKYEDVDNVLAASNPGPHYARDAWAMGQMIGTMSGSDDHMAHPGMVHGGLSAVLAPTLSRNAIHNAVTARHTYATTGHRIYLSFSVNGHLMGDEFTIGGSESPVINVKAAALDKIGIVEVMKFNGFRWEAVYQHKPLTKTIEITFTDEGFESSSLYYVRLRQEREYKNVMEYRGRWVLAWSSPVWVTRTDNPWWRSDKIIQETNQNPWR